MPDAQLQVTGPQGRRIVPLDTPVLRIGRRTAADLQIGSTDVSREHAEIARDGDVFVLRDLGSRYGTYVNGDAVTERVLSPGDRIRLGRSGIVELVFHHDSGMEATSLRETATDLTALRQMAAVLNGLSTARYTSGVVRLDPGDLVVVCSDGITEGYSSAGEEFGRERLIGLVQRCHGMKPDAVLDDLLAAVRTFVGTAAQADDITALVMRFSGVRAGGDALPRETEIGLSHGQAR